MKRIVSGLAALLLCLSLCAVPAKAEYINNSTYWQWVAGHSGSVQNILGYIPGMGVCPSENSPDQMHHANNYQLGEVLGQYVCTCEYCGQTFIAHESDMQTAYNDYVQQLPLNGVDDQGGFLWTPTPSDFYDGSSSVIVAGQPGVYLDGLKSSNYASGERDRVNWTARYDGSSIFTSAVPRNGYSYTYDSTTYAQCWGMFHFSAPVSGIYSKYSGNNSFWYAYSLYNDSGANLADSGRSNFTFNSQYLSQGNKISLEFSSSKSSYQYWFTAVSARVMLPTFQVIPDVSIGNDLYAPDSRPANLGIDLNITIDNTSPTPTPAPSSEIVNETNNTVYNPVTGDTTTYNSWQYDYSSRTYTFDNSQGDTTTVTYGDQYITIQEGSTTYNVYYLTQQPEHQHTYTVTSERPASCAGTGSKTYTCSDCGNTYTETSPALGHDWQVKSTAQTEYDENGELLTQGYTIYRCSRCGEEYRSEDGTVPNTDLMPIPDGETGLTEYWNKVTGMFQKIPEMFGDITRFLHDTWSYVPEDVFTLIYFGLSMVVFVGIVGWIFRR